MNTIPLKKKKIYNDVSNSDDSTSGSDNNHAMLQHNKKRITVKSDEKEHTLEKDTQAEDREEDKTEGYLQWRA